MALIPVEPVPIQVETGWFDVRPRRIVWGTESLPVIGLAAVRDETQAYPVAVGPRIRFEVETPRARFALTYRPRGRRWTLDAIDQAA